MLEHVTQWSILITILTGLVYLWAQIIRTKIAKKSTKLELWTHLNTLLEQDERIRSQVDAAIAEVQGLSPGGEDTLLGGYTKGCDLYFSDLLKDFRKIGRHYETVGAALRRGYLDFKLAHDVILFPTEFWNATSAIRSEIRQNWYGPNEPNDKWWEHFEWMHCAWSHSGTVMRKLNCR